MTARRTFTAAEKAVEDLLTPDSMRAPDESDLEPDPLGLTPDWLRRKKNSGDDADELPAKAKTRIEQVSDDLKEIQKDADKLFAASADYIERREAADESERVSIREWLRKAEAKRDLSPDKGE